MRSLGLAVCLLSLASAFLPNTVQRKKPDSFEDAMKEFVGEWDTKHHPHQKEPPDDSPPTEDEEGVDSTPATVNCSSCAQSDERRALRLATIKNQILNQLGLSKPPNVTGKLLPQAPPLDHLLDHYHMQADGPGHHAFVPGPEYADEDEFHITTEKLLSFAHRPPKRILADDSDNVLYFKFSSSVTTFHVQSAHLWIFIRPNQLVPQRNISIYQIARQSNNDYPELIQVRKKSVEKKSRHGHWIVFEVKKLVIHWFRYMKENHGILVRSSSPDPTELILDHVEDSKESTRPFIEIKVEKQRHRRTKRMIGLNCEENSKEVRCCRYPLTVDFTEFGWDWIIAPLQYEANYCSGECPYVFLQKYPHTHLVQQANRQGSAGPCCAPRKMSSISMIYFDADYNIVYGILPGMVVDRCGCS